MKLRKVGVAIAVCLVSMSSVVGAKTVKTISVDCLKGDSINAALEEKADKLILEIRGICREDVIVRRDSVTLRGSNPATDGVQAIGDHLFGAAVLVHGAAIVVLENLKLSGGPYAGLDVEHAPWVVASNCRFEGNGAGAWVGNSLAIFYDSTFTGNQFSGLWASDGAHAVCRRCILRDNPPGGGGEGDFLIDMRSQGVLIDSEVVSADYGVWSHQGSQVYVIRSTIEAPGSSYGGGSGAGRHATLDLVDSEVNGSIQAFFDSRIDTTRSAVNGWLSIGHESTLLSRGATLVGDVGIGEFATATISADSAVEGSMSCHPTGDAYCVDPAGSLTGTSNCSHCLCLDDDGDGFYAQAGCGSAVDCDDGAWEVNPDAVEVCEDGIDNDCDGIDAACS